MHLNIALNWTSHVAFNVPGPGRLRRVIKFAHKLGALGATAYDAFEAIERALWGKGLLSGVKASERRAWIVAATVARDAYQAGADAALVRIAAEAIGIHGPGYGAAYVTAWKCCTFASDEEIARALGMADEEPWWSIREARRAHADGDDAEFLALAAPRQMNFESCDRG